ncbi:hypothetical protein EV189_3666 [Motilibacter rhizosphaerae]|uniref:Uncharacterized protein n=1 Tax=Motilibacter rhizosphaerae TaxID=598652 RepID=A0A4Q7NBB5_9ACTN|nr:hypothetical protein [Motilibacter rhizosphaerae]RZS80185.1 hypothetical protein EV189_3666 [Motilibacter rhizosphaerae]
MTSTTTAPVLHYDVPGVALWQEGETFTLDVRHPVSRAALEGAWEFIPEGTDVLWVEDGTPELERVPAPDVNAWAEQWVADNFRPTDETWSHLFGLIPRQR